MPSVNRASTGKTDLIIDAQHHQCPLLMVPFYCLFLFSRRKFLVLSTWEEEPGLELCYLRVCVCVLELHYLRGVRACVHVCYWDSS